MPLTQRNTLLVVPDAVSRPHHLFSSKTLVSAEGVEIENANQLSPVFWRYLDEYFGKTCNLRLGANGCISIYFDTDNLDLLKVKYSLRDRPGGRSSCGKEFPDQFGLKHREDKFQNSASEIARRLFPGQNLDGFLPYVRAEIERPHNHPRNVTEYRYFDLPDDIQLAIADRIPTKICKHMVFKPQFVTFVERRKYEVFVDPHQPFNPISPTVLAKPNVETLRHNSHVCIEVAMDKCVYREPTPGLTVKAIVAKSKSAFNGFGRHKNDKWILEHEFKKEESGSGVTDHTMIGAYMRFRMFIYDLGIPAQSGAIRTAGSKAARGYKSMLTSKRGMAAHPDGNGLWRLAP